MTQSNTATTSVSDKNVPGAADRLHFLDHLRAVVIMLVIVLHTSMTYMAYPPTWWYVIEPKNSIIFTVLVLLLDVPIMQTLFFIAGFFAYTSLERYGAARFLRQKVVRLGLPWLFSVIFLAPLVTYLITVTRGIARPYLKFWSSDFWGPYYQQSVYWFLGILLLLFALFAIVYNSEPRLQHILRQPQTPRGMLFIIFWAVTTLGYFILSLYIPPDTWFNELKLFVFQPARLILYAGYFSLGIYADRRGWFRENGYRPNLDGWGPAAILTGLLYLGLRLSWSGGADILQLATQAALFNAFCLSALMASTALFQRFVNRPTRLWSSLARNSFAIYYLHPLILYPAAYVALSVEASIFLEVIFLATLTALIAWGLGALILTRWPVLQDVF